MDSFLTPITSKKAFLFFGVIAFTLYFFGLFNNFVGDDNTQIIANNAVHSLQHIPTFFFTNRLQLGGQTYVGGLYYKPLLDTTYALLYAIGGYNPFIYHVFQLALHVITSWMIFLFLKKHIDTTISFVLSLFFLIHPINSESVLYIADVQDVLFVFFGMSALLILSNFQTKKSIIYAGICLLFSLLSKETGILFVVMTPLYMRMFKRNQWYFSLLFCVLVCLLYAILRIHAIGLFPHALITAPIERLPLITRLLQIPNMFFFYIITFLFPYYLSSSWQWIFLRPDIVHFFLPFLIDIVCIVFIILVGTTILNKHKTQKMYWFFCVWFLLGMLFHMQLLPLDQTVAERWFYFPMIGLLGIIGIIWETLPYKHNKYVWVMVSLICILLATRTFIRSLDWKDDFTLALHDSDITDSYNLESIISHTYYLQGKLSEAKMHAQKSITFFPYITNYTNLGAIESRMGNYEQAQKAYQQALRYGDDTLPYENLASLALVYGDRQTNINFIKQSLKKYPTDGILWFNLTILEYTSGDSAQAKKDLEKAKTFYSNDNVLFVEYIMKNNKPLHWEVKNGGIIFYSL